MLFIGKKPKGRSILISNATNPLCGLYIYLCDTVWLVCDLVVMCVQAVSDRTFGDLCVCDRCGPVQGQIV